MAQEARVKASGVIRGPAPTVFNRPIALPTRRSRPYLGDRWRRSTQYLGMAALLLGILGFSTDDVLPEHALIIAHRRNSIAGIEDAVRNCANGIEVDVRFDWRDRDSRPLVLSHDPVTTDSRDLLGLTELYTRLAELSEQYRRPILVYLHFRKGEDAVAHVAEQAHLLGAFRRFIFFGEDDQTIRSIVRAKQAFPLLIAKVNPRYVDMAEIEQWFAETLGGSPDFVQFSVWTPDATRARLRTLTNLAFDTMLNSDLVPLFPRAAKSLVSRSLQTSALIQTDYPERFRSSCQVPRPASSRRATTPTRPFRSRPGKTCWWRRPPQRILPSPPSILEAGDSVA
jgi:hypothetical protein